MTETIAIPTAPWLIAKTGGRKMFLTILGVVVIAALIVFGYVSGELGCGYIVGLCGGGQITTMLEDNRRMKAQTRAVEVETEAVVAVAGASARAEAQPPV